MAVIVPNTAAYQNKLRPNIYTRDQKNFNNQKIMYLLTAVRCLTWPSRRDSSRNAMMINTAAKPPDTNETNFAIMEIIGEGNWFRYWDACSALLLILCLNKWSTYCRNKQIREGNKTEAVLREGN